MRGILLRLIGFPLPGDGKISCDTRLGGFDLRIGRDFAANERCWIDDRVVIGDHVRLGHGVKLVTATHPVGPAGKRRGEADVIRPIVLEDGVWLWADALVQPGVTVARGCIVATASVVVKDTRPNGFYAGNPARRVADIADDGTFVAIRRRGTESSRSDPDARAIRRRGPSIAGHGVEAEEWAQARRNGPPARHLVDSGRPYFLAPPRSGSRGRRRTS